MLNKIFPERKTTALILAIILGALGIWLASHFVPPTPRLREFSRPMEDFLPQSAIDKAGAQEIQL